MPTPYRARGTPPALDAPFKLPIRSKKGFFGSLLAAFILMVWSFRKLGIRFMGSTAAHYLWRPSFPSSFPTSP